MEEHQNPLRQESRSIPYYQPRSRSNQMGIAGFILAIIALFVGGIPIIGWIVWLLGLIFSILGLRRAPKGLAIAGLVISLIGFVLMVAFLIAMVGVFAI